MAFDIHDSETGESKKFKMTEYLQPAHASGADGTYAVCPNCENRMPGYKQPEILTKRHSPASISGLVGNRNLKCGHCGSSVKLEFEGKNPDEGIAYTITNRRIFGKRIPFIKKKMPLGFDFKNKK